MSRSLVMEGSLEEFDLVSVLQTVSIGRQTTGIELSDERGDVVGTMFVKAGQVLAASAEGTSGIDAVRRLVRTRRSHRFRVFRERGVEASARIGPISDVLLDAIAEEDAGEPEAVLMEGSLRDFTLRALIDTVSLGRQCVGIDLFDERDRRVGTVCIKGGQVLLAEHGARTGVRALAELLRAPRSDRFVMFKTTAPARAVPIVPVSELDALPTTTGDEGHQTSHVRAIDGDPEHDEAALPKVAIVGSVRELKSGTPTRPLPLHLIPSEDREPSAANEARTHEQPVAREQAPSAALLRVVEPSVPEGTEAPLFRQRGTSSGEVAPAASEGFLVRRDGDDTAIAPLRSPPIICVTSPKGGSGQTTVVLNLAVALARRDLRVALVDASANGLLVALDAVHDEPPGLADVLSGHARIEDVRLPTRMPGLSLYPSGEGTLSGAAPGAWSQLFATLQQDADLVLIDCPAGLEGCAPSVLTSASHTLIVLAAEPASLRALGRHEAQLAGLGAYSAQLLGLVLNQLDYQARASLRVLEELCTGPDGRWIFDVPIPRSPAFLEASSRGVPIAHESSSARPTIGWVFELLASSVLERLGLLAPCLAATPLL